MVVQNGKTGNRTSTLFGECPARPQERVNTMPLTLKDIRLGKKKPVKTKKNRPHVHGICPQCGTIFHGTKSEHADDCGKEIPAIMVRKRQTDRQLLCMALDELCRLITTCRDGCNCVLAETDGQRCSGGSQWGHVVPQGSSSYLIYNLSNSFRQCESHNGIHRFVQLTFHLWYKNTFGELALDLLEKTQRENPSYKPSIPDLKDKLSLLNYLYENRYYLTNTSMEGKVGALYYGDIIRDAWVKEGRI